MSFKGKRLFGPPRFREVADAVLEALRTSKGIERIMTTDKYVADKATTTITEIRTDTGIRLTGPELSPVLHLAKHVGRSIQPVPAQIDLVVDRSSKMGLDIRQTGITREQFIVLGPGFLNDGPGGSPTSMSCSSTFRIIAGSDDLLHLRDLLLLPDAAGYVGMFKTDMSVIQQEVLGGNDLDLSTPTSVSSHPRRRQPVLGRWRSGGIHERNDRGCSYGRRFSAHQL